MFNIKIPLDGAVALNLGANITGCLSVKLSEELHKIRLDFMYKKHWMHLLAHKSKNLLKLN